MNITFIQVTSNEDIKKLSEIAFTVWHEAFKELLSLEQIEYMIDKFQSYNALNEAINKNGYRYYFIKDNNTNLGYIGLKFEKEKIFLSKLYILNEYRGNKIATKSFEFIKQLGRDNSLNSVYLTVNKYNDRAIQVYKHLGLKCINDIVTDIGNGFVMDDFVFELCF